MGPAVAVVGLLAWATFAQGGVPQPGDAAPSFSAERLGAGDSISLADFEGRPVVLNFWASWCLPCEDEAPLFNDMARDYEGEVAFLGVNIKDTEADALAFEKRFELAYPSVRDEGRTIERAYGLTGQPETFFIAADGTISEHIPGAIVDPAELQALLEDLASTADAR